MMHCRSELQPVPFTGPDGTTPVEAHWQKSSFEGLIGQTNATAIDPYPLNNYSHLVSVNEVNATLQVSLSPNPVNENLKISFENTDQRDIELMDISIHNAIGRLIIHSEIPNGANESMIDVSELTEGIYFASLKTSQGLVTRKFVKE